ncbi:MAG: outer membrane protein assembly factor BamE [Pelistega sp.]|nr:outer membrane protein assembly factor BamE [Pelistega sp.]
MRKFSVASLGIALMLSACGNLSKITKEGTSDNPIWPAIEDSVFEGVADQKGSWPIWDNVRRLEAGMNKQQLYQLIGRPHYHEGWFDVREWDYVFNARHHGEHKVCQFKVLFDTNMNARTFLWKPGNCVQAQ